MIMTKFNCTLPWTTNERYKFCSIIDKKQNQTYGKDGADLDNFLFLRRWSELEQVTGYHTTIPAPTLEFLRRKPDLGAGSSLGYEGRGGPRGPLTFCCATHRVTAIESTKITGYKET